MLNKVKTIPILSDTSPIHLAAINKGKEHFINSHNYNVLDEYKGLPVEEIKSKLKNKSFPYAVCVENWLGDLNVSSAIRNANAFGARDIFYVGVRRYDKRGTVGTHNYKDVKFLATIEDLKLLKSKYRFIGIDNIKGAVPINSYNWYGRSKRDLPPMVIFGEEGCGLTDGMKELCEEMVEISMFGSVRSLNCATASGIVMHSIVSQLEGV